MSKPDEIDDINALNRVLILNKCLAIARCHQSTLTALAEYLDKPLSRVSEWVSLRKVKPEADTLFKMRKWASDHTLQIAMAASDNSAGRKLQIAYRSAYREIADRFPANGKD